MQPRLYKNNNIITYKQQQLRYYTKTIINNNNNNKRWNFFVSNTEQMVFLSSELLFCLFSKRQSQNKIFWELSLTISKSCRNDLTMLRQQPKYCIPYISVGKIQITYFLTLNSNVYSYDIECFQRPCFTYLNIQIWIISSKIVLNKVFIAPSTL